MSEFKSNQLSDYELIIKVIDKDEKAFLELYKRYHFRLLNFVFLIVKDQSDAEEVVQEAFFQVWNKADKYKPERGTFTTWIMTISKNRALDKLRRKKYKRQTSNIDDYQIRSNNKAANILILEEDKTKHIKKAINSLPKKQQTAIYVVYFEDATHIEAASKLNVPAGTIKTRLRLGLTKLRDSINKNIVENY